MRFLLQTRLRSDRIQPGRARNRRGEPFEQPFLAGLAKNPVLAVACRLGGAATAGVLLLLTMSIAIAWGWTHPFTSGTPVTTSNTTPTQCTIPQADTPMTPSAVGSDCGFHVTSTVVQTDCRNITNLPLDVDRRQL